MAPSGSEEPGWAPDVEQYFAAKAESYDDVGSEPYWRFSDALLLRHIRAHVPVGVNDEFLFLDAGGGTGRWSIKVLEAYPHSAGLIVDMSVEMLAVARNSLVERNLVERLTVLQANLDEPWESNIAGYKLIMCFHNVLGFVSDPVAVVRNLAQRLETDGVLLLVVPNWLHAAYYSVLRSSMSEIRRLRSSNRVQFSRGPSMAVFDPIDFGRELSKHELSVTTFGFPTTIYPAPSATFARANDAVAQLLSDKRSFDELLELEWKLSSRAALASRGNNLLLVVRR